MEKSIPNVWTQEEKDFLIKNYKILGPTKCSNFINRTIGAIKTQARKLNLLVANPRFSIPKEEIDEIIYKIKTGESSLEKERKFRNLTQRVLTLRVKDYYPNFSFKDIVSFYKVNHDFFDKIGPDQAYVLGLIASDGNVRSIDCGDPANEWSISLHKNDSHILEEINHLMQNKKSVKYYKQYPMARLSIYSEKMVKKLISLEITPRKTGNYKIHPMFFENHDLFFHFLRGIFDGNGSICCVSYTNSKRTRKDFTFSICQSLFSCKQISTFLNEKYDIGAGNTINHSTNENVGSVFINGNKQLCKLYHLLYKDAKIYLNRKYNKWQELITQQISL